MRDFSTNFNADAEGITADEVIQRLLEMTPMETDETDSEVFDGAAAIPCDHCQQHIVWVHCDH